MLLYFHSIQLLERSAELCSMWTVAKPGWLVVLNSWQGMLDVLQHMWWCDVQVAAAVLGDHRHGSVLEPFLLHVHLYCWLCIISSAKASAYTLLKPRQHQSPFSPAGQGFNMAYKGQEQAVCGCLQQSVFAS